MSWSHVKNMLVCFFDHKGVVHYEFIAQGQAVNQQCLQMLIRLQNLFGGKDPESGLIIGFSTMIMPHAHDALRVCEFLAKNCITEMDHPPYSPDLVPCNFWLFPKLKNALKGQRFADLSDIKSNVKTLLRGILENNFQDSFRQWHHRLTKCITSQGEYFEGDSSR